MSEKDSVDRVTEPEAATEEELTRLQSEIAALEADIAVASLTPRQRAFIREYPVDLNATKAAIRAGYSSVPASAGLLGHLLLKNPIIKGAINKALEDRAARIGMTQDTVIAEMAALATSSVDHYYIDDEGQVQLQPGAPSNAMAAIQSIKKKTRVHYGKDGEITGKDYDVEIRLWDKPTPLKLMGRHVGITAFSDRVEVTGKDGEPIVTKIIREIVDAKHDDSHS